MDIIFETFNTMNTLKSKPTPGAVHTPSHKCLPMPWQLHWYRQTSFRSQNVWVKERKKYIIQSSKMYCAHSKGQISGFTSLAVWKSCQLPVQTTFTWSVQHSLNVRSLKLVIVEEKLHSMGQHLTACMHLVYFLFRTVV